MFKTFVCSVCQATEKAKGGNCAFKCQNCRPQLSQKEKIQMDAAPKVANARVRGILVDPRTLLCVDCGQQACCYDHREYAKPLDVAAVCRSCNVLRGPAIDSPNHNHRSIRAKAVEELNKQKAVQ